MIIEGFEIENWTCIKKLVVSDLPPTGVVVLHGPNRTGKSSVVQALRACLMDYPSTSTALKSSYPRGTGEKPTVAMTYSTGGTTYRITKCFGSSKSELAVRTSTGAWRVEANTASEAHAKVCDHVGGDDSGKGLRQLLWLTQAEYRLPDSKKFDPDVQAQLRGILGVLQTALDDRFIGRVKGRWNLWHAGQRKVGKRPQVKEGCKLALNLTRLGEVRRDLDERELEFGEMERLLQQTSDLETRRFDLGRLLNEQKGELSRLQEEREHSQARIAARRLAEERHSRTAQEHVAALDEVRQRADAAGRLAEAESTLAPSMQKVEFLEQLVQSMVEKQARLKSGLGERRERRRLKQERTVLVAERLRLLGDADKLGTAREELRRAQEVDDEVAAIKRFLLEHPVPDGPTFIALKGNHERILKLQADRDAASMTLRIEPVDGAGPARLSVDGTPPMLLAPLQPANTHSVRRKAQIDIPDWGRVELTRGAGRHDLDQIETDLRRCREELARPLAAIGIDPSEPEAFERLLRRNAEHGLKVDESRKREGELKGLAPKGLEPLRRRVLELEVKLKETTSPYPEDADPIPADQEELENLKAELDGGIAVLDAECMAIEQEIETADLNLGQGRPKVTRAKEVLAGCEATANTRREELGRMRAEEQIARRERDAKADMTAAESELKESELTAEESTIDERVVAGKEAVSALERQARENEENTTASRGGLRARKDCTQSEPSYPPDRTSSRVSLPESRSKKTRWIASTSSSRNAARNSWVH